MAVYAVFRKGFRGSEDTYYRYGRLMKNFESAMKLANKYPKAYVEAIGGTDHRKIVHINLGSV